MKRVFIIHGWNGSPEGCWIPWLKRELEKRGFEVTAPEMPNPSEPRIETWVSFLSRIVGQPNAETYFVGHSMGCQTIARYLEVLPEGMKIGGAIFVGGFFKKLTGLENSEEEVRKHWLETPLDLKKVKSHLPKSIAIFSDDDPFVPLENQDNFHNQLGSEIIIEHQKGHFDDEAGITELPVVLEKILEMAEAGP